MPEAFCLWVHCAVRKCVCASQKYCEHHIWKKNQWRKFHPILVTYVLGFLDVLIRFGDHKVKGQGHSRQWPEKPREYNIFVNIRVNFTKIRSRMCLHLRVRHTDYVKSSVLGSVFVWNRRGFKCPPPKLCTKANQRTNKALSHTSMMYSTVHVWCCRWVQWRSYPSNTYPATQEYTGPISRRWPDTQSQFPTYLWLQGSCHKHL